MPRPLTVLIVGGYGTFGGRLARLLGDVEGLTLLIGGRSLERAQEVCSGAGAERFLAALLPVAFDRAEMSSSSFGGSRAHRGRCVGAVPVLRLIALRAR